MSFTVFVCGGKHFKDRKLLERALNSVHRRRKITTFLTGSRAGAEEMAYWWAIQKPIPVVVTMPHMGYSDLDITERYRLMFELYHIDGIISFHPTTMQDRINQVSDRYKVEVWMVQCHQSGDNSANLPSSI